MKKTLIAAAFLAATNSYAALNGVSWHSRANCGNNESITWEYNVNHSWAVVSYHRRLVGWEVVEQHRLEAFWARTWRSAAVHWGEAGFGAGWEVEGFHWEMMGCNQIQIGWTLVHDCSIYDGWWNY